MNIDALLLPTLLESFGLPFYESMLNNKPIITSDLDFAIDACGESAYYFNPFCEFSMLEQIDAFTSDSDLKYKKLQAGQAIVNKLPCWKSVYAEYIECINSIK